MNAFGGRLLVEVHRPGGANFLASPAFALLEPDAGAFIDGVLERNRLGVFHVGRPAFDEPHVVGVIHFFGAFFRAGPAGDAFGFVDISRVLDDFDFKVTRISLDRIDFTQGSEFDI